MAITLSREAYLEFRCFGMADEYPKDVRAEFELRVRDLRVLYNVERDNSEVVLLIVGRKVGNKLIVGGKEFHGHRDNPPDSTADGHAGSADEVL